MLCFVVVMQSFIMNSYEVFIHIHQGYFAGTGAIVRLPQCLWSKPERYGKISQCMTTTKHCKAKTVCIFLGIYCIIPVWNAFNVWQLMWRNLNCKRFEWMAHIPLMSTKPYTTQSGKCQEENPKSLSPILFVGTHQADRRIWCHNVHCQMTDITKMYC